MNDLNEFLQPLDAPVTTHDQVNPFEFDTTSDRGMVNSFQVRNASISNAKIGTAAIGTANIGTLTFNEISGGTATLGGVNNGNGVLQVLNSSGGTSVIADNTGLTVSGTSGTTIIDPTGLVSLNNFREDSVFDFNLNIHDTSTSPVVIPGGTLSFNIPRDTWAVVSFLGIYDNSDFAHSNGSHTAIVSLEDTLNGHIFNIETGGESYYYDTGAFSGVSPATKQVTRLVHFFAGTHRLTETYQAKVGGTVDLFGFEISYILLGN